MKQLLVIVFVCTSMLLGKVAYANECIYLWLERNTIFDQAGYCFKTNLGKSVFDNSDCYSQSPSLSNSSQNRIATIAKREKVLDCAQEKKGWTTSYIFDFTDLEPTNKGVSRRDGSCAYKTFSGWFVPMMFCGRQKGQNYIDCIQRAQEAGCNIR